MSNVVKRKKKDCRRLSVYRSTYTYILKTLDQLRLLAGHNDNVGASLGQLTRYREAHATRAARDDKRLTT
jgi:hypothetical protein